MIKTYRYEQALTLRIILVIRVQHVVPFNESPKILKSVVFHIIEEHFIPTVGKKYVSMICLMCLYIKLVLLFNQIFYLFVSEYGGYKAYS